MPPVPSVPDHSSIHAIMSRDFGLAGPGAHLVIPSILGPILAAVLVFNRVYWRIALVNALGYDDTCILLSLLFLFALCCVNLVGVDAGYGHPSDTLAAAQIHRSLQMFYLDQIFYKATINLTKLSILALYLRIFSQRWFRLTCLISALLITVYAIASILATILQCSPLTAAFDKSALSPGTYHCISSTAFWYANAIFNILTDLVILLSVPGVVWGLHLPLRQRIGLTLVFGLGIFVFATSILRFTTLNAGSKSGDPDLGTLASTMWTMIEASSAVVCACLPMVRTPLQRVWPRLFPGKSAGKATLTTLSGSGTGHHEGNGGDADEIALSDNVTAKPVSALTKNTDGPGADQVLGRKQNQEQDLESGPPAANGVAVNFTYRGLGNNLSNPNPGTDESPSHAAKAIINPRLRPGSKDNKVDSSGADISKPNTENQILSPEKPLSDAVSEAKAAETDWYGRVAGASVKAGRKGLALSRL